MDRYARIREQLDAEFLAKQGKAPYPGRTSPTQQTLQGRQDRRKMAAAAATLDTLDLHDETLATQLETATILNDVLYTQWAENLRRPYSPGRVRRERNFYIFPSSGNNLDCLIHSVLSSMFFVFLSMEKMEIQNKIASLFRRKIIVNWIRRNEQKYFSSELQSKLLREFSRDTGDLGDDEINAVAKYFGIGILVVVGEQGAKIGALSAWYNNSAANKNIIVYNASGRTHFEPMGLYDSQQFIFPNSFIEEINTYYQQRDLQLVGKNYQGKTDKEIFRNYK